MTFLNEQSYIYDKRKAKIYKFEKRFYKNRDEKQIQMMILSVNPSHDNNNIHEYEESWIMEMII